MIEFKLGVSLTVHISSKTIEEILKDVEQTLIPLQTEKYLDAFDIYLKKSKIREAK